MRPLKLNEKKQDNKTNQMRNAFNSFSVNDRKRIQGKLREYGYESLLWDYNVGLQWDYSELKIKVKNAMRINNIRKLIV